MRGSSPRMTHGVRFPWFARAAKRAWQGGDGAFLRGGREFLSCPVQCGGGLKQLDAVGGWVLAQHLLAAWSFDDIVSKRSARAAKTRDFSLDIINDEVNTVPATGSRLRAIRHGSSGGTGRSTEQ